MDITDMLQAAATIQRYCGNCPVISECDAEARSLQASYRHSCKGHGLDGIWGGRVWREGKPYLPDREEAAA